MVTIFKYIESLDCFVIDPTYKEIATNLGLTEWNEVVWIGRYFLMDNDFGEHWFDNWEQRENLEGSSNKLGINSDELFILDPDRFKNGIDGPCHTSEERVLFWKDVLISLKLSYETPFREARRVNDERKKHNNENFIHDLEERIASTIYD